MGWNPQDGGESGGSLPFTYYVETDGSTVTVRDKTFAKVTSGSDFGTIFNSLVASFQRWQFAPGEFPHATGLILDGLIGVNLWGAGGMNNANKGSITASASLAGASVLAYSGTGVNISKKKAQGCIIADLAVVYDNSGHLNYVIDYTGDTTTSTRHNRLLRSYVGAVGSANLANNSKPLLFLKGVVNFAAEDCLFEGGYYAAQGGDGPSAFANVVQFNRCRFERYGHSGVYTPLQSWRFSSCHWEPGSDGLTVFAIDSRGDTPVYGLTLEDCWLGDSTSHVPSPGGAYLCVNGNGIRVVGGYADLRTVKLIYVNRGAGNAQATSGIRVEGVMFYEPAVAVVDVSGSSPADVGSVSIIDCEPLPSSPVTGTPSNLTIRSTETNMLTGLPTADPAVAGALWNNAGVVTVSAG